MHERGTANEQTESVAHSLLYVSQTWQFYFTRWVPQKKGVGVIYFWACAELCISSWITFNFGPKKKKEHSTKQRQFRGPCLLSVYLHQGTNCITK